MAAAFILFYLVGACILITLLIWQTKIAKALRLPEWVSIIMSLGTAFVTIVGTYYLTGMFFRLMMTLSDQ
jgi:hypothetical protein